MDQKVLFLDAATGFYRIRRYPVGRFFGPVDLGLHISAHHQSLNIGVGLLAGSIFPGSNRLFVTGFSPCWRGFFVSSMGGAGLVFDNLGLNTVTILGKSATPSVLYLNRTRGEEVEVELEPVDANAVWAQGRGGVYSMMDHVYARFAGRYATDPRILATGPAALRTDMGAIASVPINQGKLSEVDTWAGRGGMGSKMLQEHGIAAVIYGGTYVDDDFRDRTVADGWFQTKYQKRLLAKDMEATTKYRFDPSFNTGGTFGVNYAGIKGRIIAFNYRTIFDTEADRLALHDRLVVQHYLKQFNEETIAPKHQRTCGEPCSALCKKMRDQYKKDYEPYQAMGPLCGVFDQRAAERLCHQADLLGFDAISVGGVLAWMMELLVEGLLTPADLGVSGVPSWKADGFDPVADSARNAAIGLELLQSIIERRGKVDLADGARKWGRRLSRETGKRLLDRFLYVAFGRQGWMVPNQYWTPGVLAPMGVMGKYYMYYGNAFAPPRTLGRMCAERMEKELAIDTAGFCRFHRGWAEELIPEIFGNLYGLKDELLAGIRVTASRINSRNASVYWESERNVDFLHTYLRRIRDVEGETDPQLVDWLDRFDKDKNEAALDWWFEMRKGIDESLREF
ncbi:MAG TPA: aldehyde ferredoxin oxidoreductase C-terminal domain-containing protein [Spirochaetia bacterium]|nr:aldehyde ferredoxin oxidoreductase C-terminal domain-containing protein [Spirochaetia bacterium]